MQHKGIPQIPWLETNMPSGRTYMGSKFFEKWGEQEERKKKRRERKRETKK